MLGVRWMKASHFWRFEISAFRMDGKSFLATCVSPLAQRDCCTWKRAFLLLPMLMAVGIGLTLINTRAVLEALFGVETSFVRTPKFAIEGTAQAARVEEKKYRRRSGWLPYAEIGVGCYFVMMVIFAITTYNFLAVPFLSLFVAGYFWAGLSTLYAEHQSRLRFNRQQKLQLQVSR